MRENSNCSILCFKPIITSCKFEEVRIPVKKGKARQVNCPVFYYLSYLLFGFPHSDKYVITFVICWWELVRVVNSLLDGNRGANTINKIYNN